jgi:hypothetical protein
MPYIKQSDRENKNILIEQLSNTITNEGDLNYVITMLCKEFLIAKGESYSTHNTIMGVLTCAKEEWYRRRVSSYEDKKISENGDV